MNTVSFSGQRTAINPAFGQQQAKAQVTQFGCGGDHVSFSGSKAAPKFGGFLGAGAGCLGGGCLGAILGGIFTGPV